MRRDARDARGQMDGPNAALQCALAALLIGLLLFPFAGERPISHEPHEVSNDDYEYWQQLRRRDGLPERPRSAFVPATKPQQQPASADSTPPQKARKPRATPKQPPMPPPSSPPPSKQLRSSTPPSPPPPSTPPPSKEECAAPSSAAEVEAPSIPDHAKLLRRGPSITPIAPQLVRPSPLPSPPPSPQPSGSTPLRIQLEPRETTVRRRVAADTLANNRATPMAPAFTAATAASSSAAAASIRLTPRETIVRRRVVGEGADDATSTDQSPTS